MAALLVGFVVLAAVIMVARWFAYTSPATLARTARWGGAALLLGGGTMLLVTDRQGWLFWALAGLVPWLIRSGRFPGIFRGLGSGFRWMGNGADKGAKSKVETRFLSMVLDHETGTLTGEVRDGPYRGRKLNQLALDEALELHRQCAADPQSVQILEAWLDRTWPDWRDDLNAQQRGNANSGEKPGAMTREEALEILGLSPGATPEQIKTAHRRLMAMVHPDRGGSNYLAAKINLAKDILLDT